MRAWFMGRIAREKALLLVFVGAIAVVWASSVWERGDAIWMRSKQTSTDLKVQERWLLKKDEIEARARGAIEDLDSSRTFNSVRLSAELSTLARDANIASSLRSETQSIQRTAQFSVHSVRLTLNKVAWANLLQFYEAISQRAPYISIEKFSLSSARSDSDELNASLLVSSVEIAEQP
jgi:hypothetical protein